jgi:hypothetical protein
VLVLDVNVPWSKICPHTCEALWRRRWSVAVGLESTSVAAKLPAFLGFFSPRLEWS